MSQVASRCSSCGEPIIHNLDYCAVCGKKFTGPVKGRSKSAGKKMSAREKKIRAKRLKKRKELTELFKKKKITASQYAAGLKKLGYSTNVDKAMAFKKYIQNQIKAMEDMKVDPNAREGDVYYDPNQANIDLPRDADGNVIVDFTNGDTGSKNENRPTESMPIVNHGSLQGGTSGPRFGHSLFGDRGGRETEKKKKQGKDREAPRIDRDRTSRRRTARRTRAMADWDEDDEEDSEEEEFTLDLGEEDHRGESGWWDDEDWELEWTEEDEEEFGDWEIEFDEEEEEGWVLEYDDDDQEDDPDDILIEFDEDEDEMEFESDDSDVKADGDSQEDDDWLPSRKRRRRQNR